MPFGVRAETARADTMVLMLPRPTDNGARLAALLPTAIASMALGAGEDPLLILEKSFQGQGSAAANVRDPDGLNEVLDRLPGVRSVVLVVVDGLGHANLRAAAGHARTLSSLQTRRIETVIPSTTGAALTTITTGRLPGEHGLVGYKIRHPELGLVTTLKDWAGISDPRAWQRHEPLFALAKTIGARPVVIGRPAHATGGLTEAILTGAEYHGGQTIGDRFAIASQLLRGPGPILAYLYVDELDKVAHSDGWRSNLWLRRLEQLDAALDDLLRTLPGDTGVIVTADHGVIDVPSEKRLMLDQILAGIQGISDIGGEPRMRSLYLEPDRRAEDLVAEVEAALGKLAWVGTRDEAIAAGWFGDVDAEIADRLGDILVVARGENAFLLSTDGSLAQAMVGQHGGLSDEERGIPVALGGSLAGTSFIAAVTGLAALRSSIS